MKLKLFTTLLAGLFFAVQYALWFGDKNVFDLINLRQTTELTRQQNADSQQANDKLAAEVIDLKKGGETIETVARSQFGLIKKDETFYQIVEE